MHIAFARPVPSAPPARAASCPAPFFHRPYWPNTASRAILQRALALGPNAPDLAPNDMNNNISPRPARVLVSCAHQCTRSVAALQSASECKATGAHFGLVAPFRSVGQLADIPMRAPIRCAKSESLELHERLWCGRAHLRAPTPRGARILISQTENWDSRRGVDDKRTLAGRSAQSGNRRRRRRSSGNLA